MVEELEQLGEMRAHKQARVAFYVIKTVSIRISKYP